MSGLTRSGLSAADAKKLTTDGETRLGDDLYVTRCSARYFRCVSATISVAEALRDDRMYTGSRRRVGRARSALSAGLFFSLLYRRNRSIEHQLRRAISKDKVRLVYQPIVDLASKRVIGAEALARWTDEEGFAVGPDVFVQHGRGVRFCGRAHPAGGAPRLARFCRDAPGAPRLQAQHQRDRRRPGRSRVSAHAGTGAQSRPEFQPQNLAIEITESSTARHQAARDAILRLRQRGHSVQVDDFGTGYSSLSYLHDLFIDTIKIDRSFTQAIGTEAVTVSHSAANSGDGRGAQPRCHRGRD